MYLGNIPQDQYLSVKSQQITGTGSATYTLNYSVSNEEDVAVFVNNVRQNVSSYTVSGTSLTLGGTISVSDECWVLFLGRTVGTKTPAVGSVTNDMLAGSINESKLLGSIPNSKLANSSVTVNGTSISLGASGTISAGITVAQQFNLTSDQNNTSNFFYTSNLSVEGGSIGTAITESSGVFSFPSTGVYQVSAFTTVRSSSTSTNATLFIYFATDGATFNKVASSGQRFAIANKDFNMYCSDFVDVTDISNCQVKFGVDYGGGTMLTRAGTDGYTKFSFIRLGDT